MAYIGKTPVLGNFVKLDAITVVNGQAAYTMQNGGVNFTDYTTVNQFLVSLNGTIQAATDSFTVSGSTITFASNLSTGDVIDFIIVFGNSLSAGTVSDSAITTAKLADSSVTTAKINADAVTQAKISDQSINEAKLQVSNAPTNGYMLTAQSGNTGGLTWAEASSGGTILQSINAFKIDVQSFNYNSGRVVVSGLNVTLPNAVASDSKLFITGVVSAGGDANGDPGVSPLWEYSTDNSTWQTVQRTTWQTSTGHAGTDSNSNVGNSMGYDGWGSAADIKHSAWSTMCSASDVSQARYYRVTIRQLDNTNNTVRVNGNYDQSSGFAPSGISSIVVMEIGA